MLQNSQLLHLETSLVDSELYHRAIAYLQIHLSLTYSSTLILPMYVAPSVYVSLNSLFDNVLVVIGTQNALTETSL